MDVLLAHRATSSLPPSLSVARRLGRRSNEWHRPHENLTLRHFNQVSRRKPPLMRPSNINKIWAFRREHAMAFRFEASSLRWSRRSFSLLSMAEKWVSVCRSRNPIGNATSTHSDSTDRPLVIKVRCSSTSSRKSREQLPALSMCSGRWRLLAACCVVPHVCSTTQGN